MPRNPGKRSEMPATNSQARHTAQSGCRSLTQAEMVLVSFYKAAGGTTAKVPYEELVLQAWRDFPEAFSLRNHPEHPDASDVHKRLYQSLKTSGLVVSLGNKVFRLTDKGVAVAKELQDALDGQLQSAAVRERARLSRSELSFVQSALKSRVFAEWSMGNKERLVDYDARVFFQFSTATPIEDRRRRVAFALEAIEKAVRFGIEGAAELEGLAKHLIERFGRQLALE